MACSPKQVAASIVNILRERGQSDYIGEPISQLEHSLQAAHLAKQNDADDETIIAALLHDIGQFLPASEVASIAHEVKDMSDVGRVGHERIGEEYLTRRGFSRKVAALVGSHVAAKRYLCAVEPGYHDTLSGASKKSLIFQGGPMSGDELLAWASNPWSSKMAMLRKWDDGAKIVGLQTDPVESYEAMIAQHLAR